MQLIVFALDTCVSILICPSHPQPAGDSTQKAVVSKLVSEVLIGNDSTKNAGEPLKGGAKPKTDEHLETNEIPLDKGVQPNTIGEYLE